MNFVWLLLVFDVQTDGPEEPQTRWQCFGQCCQPLSQPSLAVSQQ